MGSAPISCQIFESLCGSAEHTLVAVITQPDRPKGRGGAVTASTVRLLAESAGIPVLAPEKVNAPEVLTAIGAYQVDVIVVVAFGQFLGKTLLSIPRHGCINLHTSLLPRWRGAAPIQRAMANGDTVTGVTVIQMNEGMDAGAILAQREYAIGVDETADIVQHNLGVLGCEVMLDTLARVASGTAIPTLQDETLVTFAPKLKKDEGRIDWTLSAATLYNRVRAFNPWPVANCGLREQGDERLQVYRARVEPGRAGHPGELLDVKGEGPLVATGSGALRLLDVQAPGRKRMSGAAFLCGHRLSVGERLH